MLLSPISNSCYIYLRILDNCDFAFHSWLHPHYRRRYIRVGRQSSSIVSVCEISISDKIQVTRIIFKMAPTKSQTQKKVDNLTDEQRSEINGRALQSRNALTQEEAQAWNRTKEWIFDDRRINTSGHSLPTEEITRRLILQEMAQRTKKGIERYMPKRAYIEELATVLRAGRDATPFGRWAKGGDSAGGWSQFKFHTNKEFRLVDQVVHKLKEIKEKGDGNPISVTTISTPATPIEDAWNLLAKHHISSSDKSGKHGGRDQTYISLKNETSTITKKVVERFVLACPDCMPRTRKCQTAHGSRDKNSPKRKAQKITPDNDEEGEKLDVYGLLNVPEELAHSRPPSAATPAKRPRLRSRLDPAPLFEQSQMLHGVSNLHGALALPNQLTPPIGYKPFEFSYPDANVNLQFGLVQSNQYMAPPPQDFSYGQNVNSFIGMGQSSQYMMVPPQNFAGPNVNSYIGLGQSSGHMAPVQNYSPNVNSGFNLGQSNQNMISPLLNFEYSPNINSAFEMGQSNQDLALPKNFGGPNIDSHGGFGQSGQNMALPQDVGEPIVDFYDHFGQPHQYPPLDIPADNTAAIGSPNWTQSEGDQSFAAQLEVAMSFQAVSDAEIDSMIEAMKMQQEGSDCAPVPVQANTTELANQIDTINDSDKQDEGIDNIDPELRDIGKQPTNLVSQDANTESGASAHSIDDICASESSSENGISTPAATMDSTDDNSGAQNSCENGTSTPATTVESTDDKSASQISSENGISAPATTMDSIDDNSGAQNSIEHGTSRTADSASIPSEGTHLVNGRYYVNGVEQEQRFKLFNGMKILLGPLPQYIASVTTVGKQRQRSVLGFD